MAVYREEIHKQVKGQLMEREDCWSLCYDTDSGEFFVEHHWDHVNAYKVSEGTNSGTLRHAADKWTGPGAEKIQIGRAHV